MATGRIPGTSGSPLTAKGDIFAYSTTASRLPVGSDGQTLVANSAATTGLQWQTPVQQNPVLNSAFQVWQRGTTFAVSNTSAYTADRWQARVTAVCTTSYSRQTTSDTTNLPNIQYNLRAQRTAAQTATPFMILEQSFESVNSIPFAGKAITFSFYARAGANYSGASNTLGMGVYTGTGTDQNIGTGFTGQTTIISQNPVLTTTWQRFTYTGTVGVTATQIGISMFYQTVGTAGAADYFDVTGFQLEVGSVATPFHTFSTTIQGELGACQRYYQRITATTDAPLAAGAATSTTVAAIYLPLPVTMRTTPSVSATNVTSYYATNFVTYPALTALALYVGTPNYLRLSATVASGFTTSAAIWVGATNANPLTELSAEL